MTLKQYQMYVGGEWVDAVDGGRFDSFNPATGEVWASFPAAAVVDVDRAVKAAHQAFTNPQWRGLSPTQRGQLLARLAEVCRENTDHLAELETLDNGKLLRETRGQAAFLPDFLNYFAGLADKVQGDVLPVNKSDMFCYTKRQALGVVAAIIPWNSPLYLTVIKLGPALATGNTIVLKPSEHASATLLELARLSEQVGFPPGVINVVTGFGKPTGDALTKHPLVRRVAFTGGVAGAKQVVVNSSENLSKVSLELGGKSPNIIFADADLESAVNGVVAGIFAASGQSCVAGSRVIVQESIYEAFLSKLIARAKTIKIGLPTDADSEMGPIATETQINAIEGFVHRAQQQGAKLCFGGARVRVEFGGWYFPPTIFACDHQDYEIFQEEIFGPVVSVLPFASEADAIDVANNSKYGLAAGIWTKNLARAHRVADAVVSGIVWVNTYRAVSPMASIGGFNASGYGREGGIEALNEYTETKTVWINISDETMPDPFIMR